LHWIDPLEILAQIGAEAKSAKLSGDENGGTEAISTELKKFKWAVA
jgi:hypothetical protein